MPVFCLFLFSDVLSLMMVNKKVKKIMRWILPIIIIILIGLGGQWYGTSIDCSKCQAGIPNFVELEDMDKTILCWMPTHCPVKSE